MVMEETTDMKQYIEERMRRQYISGVSAEELDSFMRGVLEVLHILDVEVPNGWTINYMCGRVDRLYMTDEEWALTQED